MQVWVHVDFKGLPVTPEYLSARFSDFRAVGATHVLLEWEDMLPYSGELACMARSNAFSVAEVESVLVAKSLGLVVVPLQTLGHLEFVRSTSASPICVKIPMIIPRSAHAAMGLRR